MTATFLGTTSRATSHASRVSFNSSCVARPIASPRGRGPLDHLGIILLPPVIERLVVHRPRLPNALRGAYDELPILPLTPRNTPSLQIVEQSWPAPRQPPSPSNGQLRRTPPPRGAPSSPSSDRTPPWRRVRPHTYFSKWAEKRLRQPIDQRVMHRQVAPNRFSSGKTTSLAPIPDRIASREPPPREMRSTLRGCARRSTCHRRRAPCAPPRLRRCA